MKKTVGVLFGGKSGEHEVSLVSATSVIEHMPKDYTVVPIGITEEGLFYTGDNVLEEMKHKKLTTSKEITFKIASDGKAHLFADGKELLIDVFFPVLHGTFGEDGTMQGFFEILNTAYVGAPVMGSGMAMDKVIAKQIWGAYGLPVAPYTSFFIHEWKQNPHQYTDAIMKYLHLPCFVKPANLGSSVGISKVKTESELVKAIDLAFTFDRKIIIEKGLHVRELECAILGNENAKPSRVGEVLVGGEFYDYNDKYVNGVSKTQIPADISPRIEKEAQNIALQAFHALNLRGLARVDIFMETETNKLYLNEINTMPGFTSISMYPKLWMNMGLTFEELIDSLIMYAFEEFNAKQSIKTTFTSQSDWYKQ